jgi:acyl-CoA synthetase (AMP-forming)/AMP-acid ligase II
MTKTSPDLTRCHNLLDALNAAPRDRPFVTFWLDEDEQEEVTFGEFRRRARSHASLLLEHGVAAGNRVVIIMPQGIAAMTAFVAAMMLGAAPAILAYPNFKVEPSKYAAGLAGVTSNLAAKVVVIDEEFPDELLGHVALSAGAELIRAGTGGTTSEVKPHDCEINQDAIAFIQHSAGTTGLQKGVALTHKAVLTQIEHLAQALRIDGARDRIYSWLPLYHDMGLIACFILPMVCHVPVVMQSPLDWVMHPETMLQVITEHRCSLAWLPNFAFQFMPRRTPPARVSQYDLSSMRAFINCSEPVRAGSIDEFQRAFTSIGLKPNSIHSSYAMAENVFAVAQSDLCRADGPSRLCVDGQRFRADHVVVAVAEKTPGAMWFISSGQLLTNHEVRIVSEAGDVLDDGKVGEIVIQSDCLFAGYFNRPDLTVQVLRDGWYWTGDLGFRHDGELYVVGRKKDLLIVGGENLYPQDIEEIVATHPAIHDGRVIAMGIYNPSLGTEDIVVVGEVEREGLLADATEIECEIRSLIVAKLGVAVRTIVLKPPKWLVKSTAGKPARAATREKLLREHTELREEPEETGFG